MGRARQGFRVYASLGLAEAIHQNGDDDRGEIILFTDVADASIPKLFVNALFFILQNNIPIASRFAIAFGDERHPLARRYGKSALYFTRPFSTDPALAEVHRGEEVSAGVFESAASVVFDQAENRLHTQKALLMMLLAEPSLV